MHLRIDLVAFLNQAAQLTAVGADDLGLERRLAFYLDLVGDHSHFAVLVGDGYPPCKIGVRRHCRRRDIDGAGRRAVDRGGRTRGLFPLVGQRRDAPNGIRGQGDGPMTVIDLVRRTLLRLQRWLPAGLPR